MRISDLHRARLRRARRAVTKHRADIDLADAVISGAKDDLERAQTLTRAYELTSVIGQYGRKRQKAVKALAASEQRVAALEKLLGAAGVVEPPPADRYAGWRKGPMPGEYRGTSADGTRVECWYCGSENAMPMTACLVQLTRSETYVDIGIVYYKGEERTSVLIPRCGECKRVQEKEQWGLSLSTWVEMVSGIGGVVAGLVTFSMRGTRVGAVALLLFLCFALAFTGMSVYRRGRAEPEAREWLARPTRPTAMYPPLRELIDHGWHMGSGTPL